jgi:hypothetical protein
MERKNPSGGGVFSKWEESYARFFVVFFAFFEVFFFAAIVLGPPDSLRTKMMIEVSPVDTLFFIKVFLVHAFLRQRSITRSVVIIIHTRANAMKFEKNVWITLKNIYALKLF